MGLKKHMLAKSRFYRCWIMMKVRCLKPYCKAFPNYGGRGINVCNEWMDFENFHRDMYQSYLDHAAIHGEPDTTIERIDNDGNYTAENCKWATRKVQAANTRVAGKNAINGEVLTDSELSLRLGLEKSAISYRRKHNIDLLSERLKSKRV